MPPVETLKRQLSDVVLGKAVASRTVLRLDIRQWRNTFRVALAPHYEASNKELEIQKQTDYEEGRRLADDRKPSEIVQRPQPYTRRAEQVEEVLIPAGVWWCGIPCHAHVAGCRHASTPEDPQAGS